MLYFFFLGEMLEFRKLLLFFAFGSLFIGDTLTMTVSIMILLSNQPWLLDAEHTRVLLNLPANTSFEQFLQAFDAQHRDGVELWLLQAYRYSACVGLFACALLFCIIFIGWQNRRLVLSAHVCTLAALLLLGAFQLPFYTDLYQSSRHFRFFVFLIVSVAVGLLAHIGVLVLDRRRSKHKAN
jgi:hypothetical protein